MIIEIKCSKKYQKKSGIGAIGRDTTDLGSVCLTHLRVRIPHPVPSRINLGIKKMARYEFVGQILTKKQPLTDKLSFYHIYKPQTLFYF